VPQLEFLAVLLGDEPALDLKDSFYQRLLARDQDEAEELILERTKTEPAEEIFDTMIIPALCATRGSRNRGEITEGDERAIMTSLREIVEDLGEKRADSAREKLERARDARIAARPSPMASEGDRARNADGRAARADRVRSTCACLHRIAWTGRCGTHSLPLQAALWPVPRAARRRGALGRGAGREERAH
jgi:hypothetical protein